MIKASIKHFLIAQVIDGFEVYTNSEKYPSLYKEVQACININLLLGIVLEGFINEVGEYKLDKWTWNELEKVTTPLKFRLISGLKKGFEPGVQPMETIIKLQKIRNNIAHPKPLGYDQDIIVEVNTGEIKIDPSDDWKLPGSDLNVYSGYLKLFKDHNFRDTLENAKRTLKAILDLSALLEIEEDYQSINDDLKKLNMISIAKREKLK